MTDPKSNVKRFLPSFPIRSQQIKSIRKQTQPKLKPLMELPRKMCEQLSVFSFVYGSKGKLRQYKHQNNYCELRPDVMSPIRPNNIEISLPLFSTNNTPKSGPRNIYSSAINRRRSTENKIESQPKKIPQEITTRKILTERKSLQLRSFASKNGESSAFRKSSGSIKGLIRSKNSISSRIESPQRGQVSRKTKPEDSESASPSIFVPLYNNFEIF